MGKAKWFVLLAFIGVLLASAPAFGDVMFSDGTFNLANYNQTVAGLSGPAISIAASQCSSCGNPGDALQVMTAFGDTSTTEGSLDQGYINNTFSYDPLTQGPIVAITASVDKNLDISIQGSSFTFGNSFHPVIEQDGNFYVATIAGPLNDGGVTGFLTLSQSGLVASDFTEYDFATGSFLSGNPNFSGDPILLGLAQFSSLKVTGEPSVQITATYDNLSFDLQTVPEPSSVCLFAGLVLILGVSFVIQRRRQGAS